MIRKDREVTDRNEMLEILNACDTLRVAVSGETEPYLFPVSFGWADTENGLRLYFHGAKLGRKIDLIGKDPKVAFEADLFLGYEIKPNGGVTTRYRSVMGRGICRTVEDTEKKISGLDRILTHCGYPGFPVADCKTLGPTRLWEIEVTELTGKQSLADK